MFNYKQFLNDTSNIKKIDGAGRSGGSYSFSVVYSESNGKRVSLSKTLAEKLKLTDRMTIVPVLDEQVLLVGASLPGENIFSLSGNDKKICYNAGLARFIAEEFKLNYTGGCTSKSFGNIEIDDNDGNPIAIIKIIDPTPNGGPKNQGSAASNSEVSES